MRGLDTNVLVRYMVQDDPGQSAAATELIETQFTSDKPALIHVAVLCELVWVLSSAYGFDRERIAGAVRQVLLTECFRVQDHTTAWEALVDYAKGSADYADYLIGRANRASGAETTLTFDRNAAASPFFTLVGGR